MSNSGLLNAPVKSGGEAGKANPGSSLSGRIRARQGSYPLQTSTPRIEAYRGPGAGYRLNVDVLTDLEITLTGLLITASPKFRDYRDHSEAIGAQALRPRSRSSVFWFDRTAIGLDSASAGVVSDIIVLGSLTFPHIATLVEEAFGTTPRGWKAALADHLVLLETAAMTGLAATLAKFSVQRPRPFMYDDESTSEELNGSEGALSFFSGHTAMAFSMATSYSYLFSKRHPGSRWVAPIWLGTHALASATGVLRVMAGRHFWTDVLAGAGVGSAIGMLVPFLHEQRKSGKPGLLSAVASAQIIPVFPRGGFGAAAVIGW